MSQRSEVLDLLRARADSSPDAAAILAPGRSPVSYRELLEQVMATGEVLGPPGGRIALALPNGPELAVTFLATAAFGASAPLSPDQPQAQFERDLAELRPRSIVVGRGHDSAARAAAAAHGIPVVELDSIATTGASAADESTTRPVAEAPADGAALLLFTSGTTSRPKLVPLTAANLLHSAGNVASTLALTPADRGLVLMPLFHIHGLVAGLLAPLFAGGSIVCPPGFAAADIPAWIDELRPTWYTAVPTIHQAMLDVARQRRTAGRPLPPTFRLVRSSSSALPGPVLAELEQAFGAPVVEAYGMTEAAHQMASNSLPPEGRKPGTVGRPAGAEIAILTDDGRIGTTGDLGEIVIRGAGVTSGYLDNPEADAAAFVDGWFRTGDQGRFDDDGFLTITGRLKELINRGGEKVAPREVEEILLGHPDVSQAVAFAIPHSRLGEEVGAAVVLRPEATVTTAQLRVHTAEQLAPFKVPRRVVVVDDLPRGRTGKIERRTMAERVGLAAGIAPASEPAPPRDDVERRMASVWQEVLGLDRPPGVEDDFFDLGGDSLHVVELLARVHSAFDYPLPATIFFTGATVRGMATAIRASAPAPSDVTVVPVQPRGTRPPLFCLMRAGSIVTTRNFVPALGSDQPVLGLCLPAMHSSSDVGSLEDIAAACVETIRQVQPDGPYFLFGHSMGGMVMYEAARQLAAAGETVGLLTLADSMHPSHVQRAWDRRRTARYRAKKLFSRRGPEIVAYRVRQLLGRPRPKPVTYLPGTDVPIDWAAASERERRYVPGPAPAPVLLLSTDPYIRFTGSSDLGWAPLLAAGWHGIEVPGYHDSMMGEPHVHVLAGHLAHHLQAAQRRCDAATLS